MVVEVDKCKYKLLVDYYVSIYLLLFFPFAVDFFATQHCFQTVSVAFVRSTLFKRLFPSRDENWCCSFAYWKFKPIRTNPKSMIKINNMTFDINRFVSNESNLVWNGKLDRKEIQKIEISWIKINIGLFSVENE